ncbi:DUF2752 domain-containing protein [Arcticibacter sp. MXS-1]|uniref:DUF2752 domain-containing protein n=1 Tax=Arcticibacter sp. MXS-1 TaxID=3341726 RepID=UPI0035A997E3
MCFILAVPFLTAFYFLPERFFTTGLSENSYCLHKQLLGFNCPGCGFTRATFFLLHAQYSKALSLNPTVVFLLPILATEILVVPIHGLWLKKARYVLYLIFCISLLILYLIRIINH